MQAARSYLDLTWSIRQLCLLALFCEHTYLIVLCSPGVDANGEGVVPWQKYYGMHRCDESGNKFILPGR